MVYLTATGIYPCYDTHRTHSFDAYYACQCKGGYQGKHCTEEINECLSDPCVAPLVCYNEVNHYRCACPVDQPNCELLPWMVALIAVAVVVAVVAIIVFAVVRYKIKKRYNRCVYELHLFCVGYGEGVFTTIILNT